MSALEMVAVAGAVNTDPVTTRKRSLVRIPAQVLSSQTGRQVRRVAVMGSSLGEPPTGTR
jgi:hypothetical protein